MKSCLVAGAMALACLPNAATSQAKLPPVKDWAGNTVPGSASSILDKDGTPIDILNPLPVAGRQEAVTLATANVAAPAAKVYGGTYVFNQGCGAYGSVALRYRAADGATMITLVTKTSADSAGGTLLSLGTNTIVDVALSGTTGCNVTLARIPS
ncbi:hypothetical protein [Sphingomonas sanguinis]|uniref:hypothetical protein n=1 Tax=Sphingomonas sanguinis TaxID=33051 RepID=UPI000A8D7D65|nr:hypothetical protein [Sphingomonas sanguinis]